MIPTRCRPIVVSIPLMVALCLCGAGVAAPQSAPPTPLARVTKKPVAKVAKASKSATVRRGSIAAIDPALGKLTLKSAAGIATDYELTDKTHYWKGRRAAQAGAFAPGDAVVAHLRHSRKTDSLQVVELDDRSSWDWLTAVRHRTLPATVTALDDDTLSVTLGADRLPFTYALSPETLWSRGDKTALPADFKAGETVYVVPRALPGGEVQARAVTDSARAAPVLKERAGASLHGVIHALDAAAQTLTLTTANHDLRVLNCAPELEVVRGGKPLSRSDLKVGQTVSARLHRNDEGQMVVWRISLQPAHGKATTGRKMKR